MVKPARHGVRPAEWVEKTEVRALLRAVAAGNTVVVDIIRRVYPRQGLTRGHAFELIQFSDIVSREPEQTCNSDSIFAKWLNFFITYSELGADGTVCTGYNE